ncbi:MAG: TerB family tellurite resistance protein [Gammaproteobacteria bacterium]|nr:MAG: TerB family tellurite resistance protein [Gammaproteobacteria bacterium]
MIKRIKNLISNFSKQEEGKEEDKISSLDKACSALLIEVAYADKVFDESEIISLKESLKETYKLDDEIIDELILDAKKTVDESTSLYEYTRVVNDEFTYSDKLELLSRIWKLAFADGNLDKYEDHIIRKISDLIHVSHSDFIKIKLENRIS